MALINVLARSDTDQQPFTIGVGSVVVPNTGTLPCPAIKGVSGSDAITYGYAIVVSMSPFTIVSEDASMRWQSTVQEENFFSVGTAKPSVLAVANTRLAA